MDGILAIFALVFAGLAAGLWYWRMRSGAEIALMAATETSGAGELAGKAAGTLVELKGQLRCKEPLTSEFAEKPCVWYRALTEVEVEKTVYVNGKRQLRMEYEPENDVVKWAPSVLEDASGSVPIDFTDATVEGEQVHRHREKAGVGKTLAASVMGYGALGRRFTEWIVAADVPVYVLATALAGGKLGKSDDGKQPFLISVKSEEERTRTLGHKRIWQLIGVVICAAIALGFLYLSFTEGGR